MPHVEWLYFVERTNDEFWNMTTTLWMQRTSTSIHSDGAAAWWSEDKMVPLTLVKSKNRTMQRTTMLRIKRFSQWNLWTVQWMAVSMADAVSSAELAVCFGFAHFSFDSVGCICPCSISVKSVWSFQSFWTDLMSAKQWAREYNVLSLLNACSNTFEYDILICKIGTLRNLFVWPHTTIMARPTTNRDVLHTVSIKIFRSIYLWAFGLRIERQPLHEFCSLSYNYRQWNGENCVGRFQTSVRTWLVIASKVLLLMFYFSNSVNVELDNWFSWKKKLDASRYWQLGFEYWPMINASGALMFDTSLDSCVQRFGFAWCCEKLRWHLCS